MAEKRGIKRRLKRINLMFGVDKPTNVGFTVDISDTGIFLKSANVYPPGALLDITLSMPNDGVAHFQGQVRWAKSVPPNLIHVVKKAGMGVKIIKFFEGENAYHKLVETSYH